MLLLALVMCQCNFEPSQNQPAKKTLRDQYPEKFTEEYIGVRALDLGEKLCKCDPYNVYAFNNVFTKEYGDALKEVLALPEGMDGDGPSAGLWIEFAGELCSLIAVSDVKVTDNKAKVLLDSEYYEKDALSMVFIEDEWLIDDLENCSKKHMKEIIQEYRQYYKSIDWLDLIQTLQDRGYDKEEAVEASQSFREEIDAYFEKYPK